MTFAAPTSVTSDVTPHGVVLNWTPSPDTTYTVLANGEVVPTCENQRTGECLLPDPPAGSNYDVSVLKLSV